LKEITAPPTDTITIYVEMDEKDIHFLGSVVKGYDGVAHVRRDWVVADGSRWVKIFVPPGFERDIERIIDHAREFIKIGRVRVGTANS
jgi:hypothetical protein